MPSQLLKADQPHAAVQALGHAAVPQQRAQGLQLTRSSSTQQQRRATVSDVIAVFFREENKDREKGAKGRIGTVPLNANGRHLCTRPIRPRTRSREDHRRPRKDLLSWIPGQRVRHDHSVPSGSRSPDSLFVIVCIDG
ncbi:unnamed protein product [Gadus morhua 'NCC']